MVRGNARAIIVVVISLMFSMAYAGEKKPRKMPPTQVQGQHQGQQQGQEQTAYGGSGGDGGSVGDVVSDSVSGAEAQAINEGNNLNAGQETNLDLDASDNSSTENNSTNVVLVPNNNTESCLRVWGIAFGNEGASGGIGIPWRSKKCDYEQAADDAFAAGERETGWFWKCENPNLYRSFRDKGESNESAKADCLNRMVGNMTAMTTISTLKEQLTTMSELREIDRNSYKESLQRERELCEEANNRVHEHCQAK